MATTTPNADLMSRLARAGFGVRKREQELDRAKALFELAEGNGRVVFDEAIVNGRLSKEYALAFDSGYVAAYMGHGDTDAGRAKGARIMGLVDKKRTPKQQGAVKAARNARSRLLKKLNIKAPTDAGRKRGTKMSLPASTKEDGPTLAESQANTSKPRTATPAVPVLAAQADLVMWGESQLALWKTAQKKGGKVFTHKWRAVITAMEAALADK